MSGRGELNVGIRPVVEMVCFNIQPCVRRKEEQVSKPREEESAIERTGCCDVVCDTEQASETALERHGRLNRVRTQQGVGWQYWAPKDDAAGAATLKRWRVV